MSENGNGSSTKVTANLTLTFDLAASRLDIRAEVPNPDTALDMLTRAVRYFETVAKMEVAAGLHKQAIEQVQVGDIMRKVRGIS